MINKSKLVTIVAAFAVLFGTLLTPLTSYAKVTLPDNLYEHYEKQPESVKWVFNDDNWDLELAGKNELNYLYGQGEFYMRGYDISGATVYDIKTVYLSDSPGYAEVALNHEMGHFVDYAYYTYYGTQPSLTDAFYYIYKQEATKSYLYEDYELSEVSEYFAQSYWSYVEEPQQLKDYYPMTYKYIDDCILDLDAAIGNGYNRIYDDKMFMRDGKYKDTTPSSKTFGVIYTDSTKKVDTKLINMLNGTFTRIKVD